MWPLSDQGHLEVKGNSVPFTSLKDDAQISQISGADTEYRVFSVFYTGNHYHEMGIWTKVGNGKVIYYVNYDKLLLCIALFWKVSLFNQMPFNLFTRQIIKLHSLTRKSHIVHWIHKTSKINHSSICMLLFIIMKNVHGYNLEPWYLHSYMCDVWKHFCMRALLGQDVCTKKGAMLKECCDIL